MTYEYQLRLLPCQAADSDSIVDVLVREKGLDRARTVAVRCLRRSIDARRRPVMVNLLVRAYVDECPDDEFPLHRYGDVSGGKQVVVVGAGPAGLFAALRLVELGLRPVVVERGKDVHTRRKDIALIARRQVVDPESNYCYGEGGAGAFSDGKLYTRSKKRGDAVRILHIFCQHGAPHSILWDAHPHIGTDKLPRVIENMRMTIVRSGGEVHFGTRMTHLLLSSEGRRVEGIRSADGREWRGPVVLATGHSAGDVYRALWAQGVAMEAKGLAVGVRLEHPSALIDRLQYHSPEGRGRWLPPAEYSYVAQVAGRGVYSFCMCPGGFIVPAGAREGCLSVNGMSPSHRGSRWSNSGMVVELRVDDLPQLIVNSEQRIVNSDQRTVNSEQWAGPLRMLGFVEDLEHACWLRAGQSQRAPAQRMADFVEGRMSTDLPRSSYAPGLQCSPLHAWLPSFVSQRLREGFRVFGRACRGFLTNEAVVVGVETRTSSPVRIVRRADSLMALSGLFPCGEGAGYAGGIVSAGVDGERCAEAVARYLSE